MSARLAGVVCGKCGQSCTGRYNGAWRCIRCERPGPRLIGYIAPVGRVSEPYAPPGRVPRLFKVRENIPNPARAV